MCAFASETAGSGREFGEMKIQLPPCFVAGAMAQGYAWIRAAGSQAAARDWLLAQELTWQTRRSVGRETASCSARETAGI